MDDKLLDTTYTLFVSVETLSPSISLKLETLYDDGVVFELFHVVVIVVVFVLFISAGAFGALMTGVFANPLINEGNAGLLYGNPGQVWIQFQSIIAVSLYSAIVTFIIYKVISLIFGTGRITEEVEKDGMDMAYHGERGFDISD